MTKKYLNKASIFFLLLLLTGCETQQLPLTSYTVIEGRDLGGTSFRPPLYRIILPAGWKASFISGSVADTKKSLLECFFECDGEQIRLTIHNFPYLSNSQRIPPSAQIDRWIKQFDSLEISIITPQAFAGFVGSHWWGEGRMKEEAVIVSAWAMQLAAEHEQTLSRNEKLAASQVRSDISIKASGPKELMESQKDTIWAIARSFELTTFLPNP
jgi:hypothetical protein